MPRISAEARSVTAHQAGGKPPSPPKEMRDDAAALWRRIVRAKPLGWFDDGSLGLLRQYCETTIEAQEFTTVMAELPVADFSRMELGKHVVRLNGSVAMLATRLRLSVQAAVDRKSRMLDEDGAGEKADDKLLGGKAVWAGSKLRAVS